jgi:hypothetical protein
MGTYDTKKMLTGKRLNDIDAKTVAWYQKIHENSPYCAVETIGYDINFNKFQNHGIEIRFLDWFPENYLEDVINILILAVDYSTTRYISNPIYDSVWNELAKSCVMKGGGQNIDAKTGTYILGKLFGNHSLGSDMRLLDFFNIIIRSLYSKKSGLSELLSPKMTEPVAIDFNSISYEYYKKIFLR